MNIGLVLAGGTGKRLGADIPKQYIEVGGKAIISYVLKVFAEHPMVDAIQIVADSFWHDYVKNCVRSTGCGGKWKGFSQPGENRQLSIFHGITDALQYASYDDFVIIHDAARPLLTGQFLTKCLLKAEDHDGVLPVLPVTDTVYISQDRKKISSLLNRDHVFAGQAPEIFRLGKYYEANKRLMPYDILKINGSTEPAVLADMDVVMVDGDEENFKITTKEDLRRLKEKLCLVGGSES